MSKILEINNDVIDLNIIVDIYGEIDNEILQDSFDFFYQHAKKYYDNLYSAFKNNSYDEVKFISHKIKSSAKTIGAIKFSDACEQLEHASDSYEDNVIDQRMKVVEHEWNKLVESIYPYIN